MIASASHGAAAVPATAAYLVLVGIVLLFLGRRITQTSGYFFCQRIEAASKTRLKAALRLRDQLEAVPNVGPLYGLVSFAVAAALWFGLIDLQLTFALFMLGFALVMAVTYALIRRAANAPRAAVLAPRSPLAPVPVWAYAASALSASALPLSHAVGRTLPEVIVGVSFLVMACCGYRMAALPALLSGNDIDAELYVENAIRHYRVMTMLYFASTAVWAYIFLAQVLASSVTGRIGLTATFASMLAFTAWWIWQYIQTKRIPGARVTFRAFGVF